MTILGNSKDKALGTESQPSGWQQVALGVRSADQGSLRSPSGLFLLELSMYMTLTMNDFTARLLWPVLRLTLMAAIWIGLSVSAEANWLDDIGYTKLATALGDDMLTGQGVFISQVEAKQGSDPNRFFPDPNSPHFDASADPFGMEPTFVNGSAAMYPNPKFSTHATNIVAKIFYGDNIGQARGANTIVIYQADDFLNNFLNCGTSGCASTAPDQPKFTDPSDGQEKFYVVQNHSWAGSLGSSNADRTALRKIDYLVDQYELTTVVGVNNGTTATPHPTPDNLLAHSYNAIAVGVSDGEHAIEATSLSGYGLGRAKPTIVVPLGTPSAATATVSGAATLMHEALDLDLDLDHDHDPTSGATTSTDGTNSEPMRAILLAGATKDEFSDFVDPGTGLLDPWGRTSSEPLDNILGVGELNVFNSYLITQGGQFAGSTTTPTPIDSYGWDYATVNSSADNLYEINIPAGSTAAELSIILTWNVDINSAFNNQALTDLNLTLRDDTGTIVDESISEIENIEHIYIGADQGVTQLAAGTYTLEVSAELLQDYGIAWRTITLFDEASADFDEDGDVDGSDFLTWQQGLGILLGATHAQGDADGDGDVDRDDLAIFEADYGSSPLVANVVGVPEPGALVLATIVVLMCVLFRRQSIFCPAIWK